MVNGTANPSVCMSSVTCVHPTQGFNFSGIFLHHSWLSGNSPTKNHEDCIRGSLPLRGLNRKGVVKQANLAYQSRYLFIIQLFIYSWRLN